MTPLVALDYASALIFAASGALAASRAQLDLVGFAFLASLTALGGGTVRDLLLDRTIFWIADPLPLAIASGAAVLVFFTAHLLESRQTVLMWLDAVALPIAVAAGVRAATEMDQSAPIIVLMGIATGCFGGLLRDIVANEVPLLIRTGKLYVTAALAGAAAAIATDRLTGDATLALVACMAVAFTLRGGSLAFGWRLPVYKPRAARPPKL